MYLDSLARKALIYTAHRIDSIQYYTHTSVSFSACSLSLSSVSIVSLHFGFMWNWIYRLVQYYTEEEKKTFIFFHNPFGKLDSSWNTRVEPLNSFPSFWNADEMAAIWTLDFHCTCFELWNSKLEHNEWKRFLSLFDSITFRICVIKF